MGPEPLRYDSGEAIRPDDRVRFAGRPGRVVFVHDSTFASLEVPEANWAEHGRGFMIAIDGGDWYFLDDDNQNEDLILVGRPAPDAVEAAPGAEPPAGAAGPELRSGGPWMFVKPRSLMVEVRVADWRRSVAWYRDVLGLRVTLEDPAGGFALLEGGREGIRVAIKGGPAGGDRRGIRLVFEVEDADRAGADLTARGVAVDGPIASAEGYREVRLVDPDGTAIGLFSWTRPGADDRRATSPMN